MNAGNGYFIFLMSKSADMNKILGFSVVLFMTFSLQAQEHKLSGLYSSDQLEQLAKENPSVLKYWETYIEKGWIITVAKEDHFVHGTITASVEEFNPLNHQIFPTDETQYFLIKGTNFTLIIHPKEHIKRLYNQSLKQ